VIIEPALVAAGLTFSGRALLTPCGTSQVGHGFRRAQLLSQSAANLRPCASTAMTLSVACAPSPCWIGRAQAHRAVLPVSSRGLLGFIAR